MELDVVSIVGSLWEYGALVVLLSAAVYKLWSRNNFLQDELMKIAKDYSTAIHELNELIKGDIRKDDETTTDK